MTEIIATIGDMDADGIGFVAVNVSAGDTTLVAAVSGKIIRVHQVFLKADDDATVRFESTAGGDALTGVMPIFCHADNDVATLARVGDGQISMQFSPIGWFWANSGELLNIEVTGGNVDGVIGYSIR